LEKNGELWKEPKKKFCYPLEEARERHKIIKYFTENKLYNYLSTKQIANDLETTNSNLMKQIGNINSIAKGKLKIRNNLLEGKRNSGYRINSGYKIINKK